MKRQSVLIPVAEAKIRHPKAKRATFKYRDGTVGDIPFTICTYVNKGHPYPQRERRAKHFCQHWKTHGRCKLHSVCGDSGEACRV